MNKRSLLFVASVLLVVVLAVLAGGCGSSGETETSVAPPTTSSAPQTTADASPSSSETSSSATTPSGLEGLKPVELSLAHMFPPQSTEAKVYEEWANKIAADTGGVLSVRLYPAGTLIAPPDILEGVKSGVADIGSGFALKPEGHEISNFLSFAMAAPDIESAAKAYDVLWDKLPDAMADEWKEYKVLWLAPTVPQTLWFRDKEVKTLEDMKGLQLRVPNRDLAKLITEFGATPTSMSAADLAIGLEKGTVDGATNTWPSTVANKMKLQYAVELQTGSFGIATPLFVVMNQSSYEKLDPALQKVIDDSLAWGREKTIATWGTAQQDAYTAFEKGGGKYITLAPEEEAKWFETYLRVQAESAKELDAKGVPGTQILETLQQALAENAG